MKIENDQNYKKKNSKTTIYKYIIANIKEYVNKKVCLP